MSEETEAGADAVDFALVAYREEGAWQVEELDSGTAADLYDLTFELRRYPGDAGALGLVSVDEDFFVLVRVLGAQTRLLLSDVSAATQWPLARLVVDHLELPLPDEEDEEPAGDLDIVADLGLGAMDMGAMLDEGDLYPDELLGDIAARLGFGRQYDELVGVPTSPVTPSGPVTPAPL
ncbi:MAG TPA: tRNA adenosine deaminase-associated protein [Nocardioidaceae bacterium]|nr:tRNA adenosine deaminase-associated protein [Nocardioidaceae bacterium]